MNARTMLRLAIVVSAFCAALSPAAVQTSEVAEEADWQELFDGQSLRGWTVTNFGGEGHVEVKDGAIQLDFGGSLTGVTYDRAFPRVNYEVTLQAKRVDGIDFFCATTFPVHKSYCSLIVGGWAGSVVGLSSIDDRDASQNETTRYMKFENDRWYQIRVRVTDLKISAWIDEEQVVDVAIAGRKIGTRVEVDLSRPFGIAAWETRAALRNIRVRKLSGQTAPAESRGPVEDH